MRKKITTQPAITCLKLTIETLEDVNMGPAKWRVTVSGKLRFMTSYLES